MGLNEFSAHEVINKLEYEDLYKIIKFFEMNKKQSLFPEKL